MRKAIHKLTATLLLLLMAGFVSAQDYSFDDFVGTWHGTIMSPSTNGNTIPITMTIEPDGFYTETSGVLMPTLYPNTQQCEYQSATNRMHWWYLGTAWGGQYFYDHFFYEVVYFENGVLEMHYNYWDDPEPHPETGIIYLVKEGATVMPPPETLSYNWMNNSMMLSWNEPDPGNGQLAELTGYNVYHQTETSDFELLDFVEDNSYEHTGMFEAGLHSYYVTAVYEEGESEPSENLNVLFHTPEPMDLEATLDGGYVELTWETPDSGNEAMATIEGYNIYHKPENGDWEMLAWTENNYFVHENLQSTGTHTYYVTATYSGGESDPSNQTEVLYQITGIGDITSILTNIYPNPATDFVNVTSEQEMQSVKIMNQAGQVVIEDRVNGNNYRADVRNLQQGVYLLFIETTSGNSSNMIVVK